MFYFAFNNAFVPLSKRLASLCLKIGIHFTSQHRLIIYSTYKTNFKQLLQYQTLSRWQYRNVHCVPRLVTKLNRSAVLQSTYSFAVSTRLSYNYCSYVTFTYEGAQSFFSENCAQFSTLKYPITEILLFEMNETFFWYPRNQITQISQMFW